MNNVISLTELSKIDELLGCIFNYGNIQQVTIESTEGIFYKINEDELILIYYNG